MIASRLNLKSLQVAEPHIGLVLDKFLYEQHKEDKEGTKTSFIHEQANAFVIPRGYAQFFAHWQEALKQANNTITTDTMKPKHDGRFVVGLGTESILETAICLHRSYGVPYIPASALKGLAAHFADSTGGERWKVGSEWHTHAFGSTDTQGHVTFFDALPYPTNLKLHPEIMTVHHKNYYEGTAEPIDWESPTPVGFISASGDFLLALQGEEKWVNVVLGILHHALSTWGIGAKTSSGYGRFVLVDIHKKAEETAKAQKALDNNVTSEKIKISNIKFKDTLAETEKSWRRVKTLFAHSERIQVEMAVQLLAILRKHPDHKKSKVLAELQEWASKHPAP